MLSEEPHMRVCAFETVPIKTPTSWQSGFKNHLGKFGPSNLHWKKPLPQNSWKCCHSCFGSANLISQHFVHCVHTLSKESSIVKGCLSLLRVWFGVINSNDTSSRIIFCTFALFFWFWDRYLEKSIRMYRCNDKMRQEKCVLGKKWPLWYLHLSRSALDCKYSWLMASF